jgi:hypothetical protein
MGQKSVQVGHNRDDWVCRQIRENHCGVTQEMSPEQRIYIVILLKINNLRVFLAGSRGFRAGRMRVTN